MIINNDKIFKLQLPNELIVGDLKDDSTDVVNTPVNLIGGFAVKHGVFVGYRQHPSSPTQYELRSYDAHNSEWITAPAITNYRENSLFFTDDRFSEYDVYIIGGSSSGIPTKDFYVLPNSYRTPTKLTDMSIARTSVKNAAYVNNKLYVTGGVDADDNYLFSVDVYDIDTDTWNIVTNSPSDIKNRGFGTDGKYLYLVGGKLVSNDSITNIVDRYNPETNIWDRITSLPISGEYINVANGYNKFYVSYGSKVYEFYTFNKDPSIYSDSSYKWKYLDYITSTSTETLSKIIIVDDLPEVYFISMHDSDKGYLYIKSTGDIVEIVSSVDNLYSSYVKGVYYDKCLYFYRLHGAYNEYYKFNLETSSWSQLATAPIGLYQPYLAVHDGKLYVMGGENTSTWNLNDSLLIYDIDTDTWSYGASFSGRAYSFAPPMVIDGKIYFYGGYYDVSEWFYDPTMDVYDIDTDTWILTDMNFIEAYDVDEDSIAFKVNNDIYFYSYDYNFVVYDTDNENISVVQSNTINFTDFAYSDNKIYGLRHMHSLSIGNMSYKGIFGYINGNTIEEFDISTRTGDISLHDITYSEDKNVFVAVGSDKCIATSTDASTWVERDITYGTNEVVFKGVDYISSLEMFLAYGGKEIYDDSTPLDESFLITSNDGINWVERDVEFGDYSFIKDVVYSPFLQTFIAFAEERTIETEAKTVHMCLSSDGASWTKYPQSGLVKINTVTSSDNIELLVSAGQNIYSGKYKQPSLVNKVENAE